MQWIRKCCFNYHYHAIHLKYQMSFLQILLECIFGSSISIEYRNMYFGLSWMLNIMVQISSILTLNILCWNFRKMVNTAILIKASLMWIGLSYMSCWFYFLLKVKRCHKIKIAYIVQWLHIATCYNIILMCILMCFLFPLHCSLLFFF